MYPGGELVSISVIVSLYSLAIGRLRERKTRRRAGFPWGWLWPRHTRFVPRFYYTLPTLDKMILARSSGEAPSLLMVSGIFGMRYSSSAESITLRSNSLDGASP